MVDVDSSVGPTPPAGPDKRRLGRWPATALVIANMIGTGIFTTSGFLVADIGEPWAVIALWGVGGLLALSGALVYAELGAAIPRSGAEVAFLSRAFHPALGFAAGWISLVVGFAAPIAASASACSSYLSAAVPGVPHSALAVVVILLVSAAHLGDVRAGGRFQLVVTGVKVCLLLVLLAGGLLSGNLEAEHLTSSAPAGTPSLAVGAIGLIFVAYAYSGWNGAAYVASEIDDAPRNLPRALIGGTVIVTAFYLALNLLFFSAVPASALVEFVGGKWVGRVDVGHIVAAAIFGEGLGRVFSVAIALALVSSVSAMVLAGPRVAVALAEQGLLPQAFARRRAGGAPWVSILTQAGLAILFAITATFESLLVFVGFTLSVMAALTVVGAWRLRVTEPELARPFRVPLWPLPAIVFLLLMLWMVGFSLAEKPAAALAGVGVVGVCLIGLVIHRLGLRGQDRSS